MIEKRRYHRNPGKGFTLIELMIVVAISAVLTAIALPQMMVQRRLTRSTAITRQILTQLRYARQLAMSQQQAVTFQYDNVTKDIRIIDHNNDPNDPLAATALLVAGDYPSTVLPATVVSTVSLLQGGLTAAEISYGIPTTATGLPAGAPAIPTGNLSLGDRIALTALDANNKFNVTFQSDGSVINPAGIPAAGTPLSQCIPMDSAMFIYNNKAAQATASAISVLGASGRVKVWRYTLSGNQFAE